MGNYYFCYALNDLVLGLNVPMHHARLFGLQAGNLYAVEPSAKFDLLEMADIVALCKFNTLLKFCVCIAFQINKIANIYVCYLYNPSWQYSNKTIKWRNSYNRYTALDIFQRPVKCVQPHQGDVLKTEATNRCGI